MGRTVIVEESASATLAGAAPRMGVLVGQVTVEKDYVLMAVATPTMPESDGKPSCSFPGEEWWIVDHAAEVTSMLPGGIQVVGVFLSCPAERLRELQPWLARLLPLLCPLSSSLPHSSRLLLHTATSGKRHRCQTLDLSDHQASFRPAELKLQPHSSLWHSLHCSVSLSITTAVPLQPGRESLQPGHESLRTGPAGLRTTPPSLGAGPASLGTGPAGLGTGPAGLGTGPAGLKELRDNVAAGVKPWVDSILCATVLVKGRVCEGGVVPLVRGVRGKKGQATLSQGEHLPATLLMREPSHPSPTPHSVAGGTLVGLEGKLQCSALVPPHASTSEAASAVREGAVRSLQSRLAALLKDLEAKRVGEGEEEEEEKMRGTQQMKAVANSATSSLQSLTKPEGCQHLLPRCVQVNLLSTPLYLFALQFPDQTEEEVCRDVCGVLGVPHGELELQSLEAFHEPRPPTPTPCALVKAEERPVVPLLGMVVAIVVAVVACALWLFRSS